MTLIERFQRARTTKIYDLCAAAPLIAWYFFCAIQLLPVVNRQIALVRLFARTDPSALPVGLVLSTLSHLTTLFFFTVLVAMFTARRPPQRTASGFYPRCIAVAGTFIGLGVLLLPPQELSPVLYVLSLVLIIGGTALAIWAALVLGRSISMVPEARRLVISGPYAIIRHPLYLGEIIAMSGVVLQYFSVEGFLLLATLCALQIQRIKVEERLLSEVFPEYKDYVARTACLLPGLY